MRHVLDTGIISWLANRMVLTFGPETIAKLALGTSGDTPMGHALREFLRPRITDSRFLADDEFPRLAHELTSGKSDRSEKWRFAELALALARCPGRKKEAREWFRKSLSLGCDQEEDTDRRDTFLERFAVSMVEGLFREKAILDVISGMNHSVGTIIALCGVGDALRRRGDEEVSRRFHGRAWRAASRVPMDVRPYALRPIARSLAMAGMSDEARSLFDEIISAARQIGNADRRLSLLGGVGADMAEAGDPEAARVLFKEVVDECERIQDKCSRLSMYEYLARKMIAAGEFDAALAVSGKLGRTMKDILRSRVVGSLANRGRFREALGVVEGIENDGSKSFALTMVSGAMAMSGDDSGARVVMTAASRI